MRSLIARAVSAELRQMSRDLAAERQAATMCRAESRRDSMALTAANAELARIREKLSTTEQVAAHLHARAAQATLDLGAAEARYAELERRRAPVGDSSAWYWRSRCEQLAAANARLDELLAAAEGRPAQPVDDDCVPASLALLGLGG